MEFFAFHMDQRANLSLSNAVDTKANLNSEVFEDIILSVGLDCQPYQTKYHLIDYSLLSRRNGIAHGEYLELDASSYKTLVDEVLQLMREVKTDIENAVHQKRYLRA